MSSLAKPPSSRTRLRRNHERGFYDAEAVHAVLDATPLCHVAHLHEGHPFTLPTMCWRIGDRVFFHGSSASRMIRAVTNGPVCLTATLFDGLVLARSAFHHSANYRSVVVVGEGAAVEGDAERVAALKHFFDVWLPGRWDTLRPYNEQEMKATGIVSLELNEASAKVRTGPPVDDEEDYTFPVWAGVLPLTRDAQALVPCPRLSEADTFASDPAPDAQTRAAIDAFVARFEAPTN